MAIDIAYSVFAEPERAVVAFNFGQISVFHKDSGTGKTGVCALRRGAGNSNWRNQDSGY
ncbi:hypothetical protein FIBSPDRAFT_970480 [Athelia psychrophila]|uniref:Uncharacterized protein n=1 Tax=Athelia psychrophila TaxID=1759441 RepID=A0A167SNL2_9AGAM|nr:hypothetical protein FIBSPDRAFT_970480 [Fibularhizoctonia sp. CBS 109695]